jgi:hypothetical protein
MLDAHVCVRKTRAGGTVGDIGQIGNENCGSINLTEDGLHDRWRPGYVKCIAVDRNFAIRRCNFSICLELKRNNFNPETTWLMRLVRPGYLESLSTIGQRVSNESKILVSGRRLEGLIVHTLERMAQIAIGLGLGGPALVQITLGAVEDVWLRSSRPAGRPIGRPEIVLPLVWIRELGEPLATLLQDQLDILWQTSGWREGSPSFIDNRWAGYGDIHNYDPNLGLESL